MIRSFSDGIFIGKITIDEAHKKAISQNLLIELEQQPKHIKEKERYL